MRRIRRTQSRAKQLSILKTSLRFKHRRIATATGKESKACAWKFLQYMKAFFGFQPALQVTTVQSFTCSPWQLTRLAIDHMSSLVALKLTKRAAERIARTLAADGMNPPRRSEAHLAGKQRNCNCDTSEMSGHLASAKLHAATSISGFMRSMAKLLRASEANLHKQTAAN